MLRNLVLLLLIPLSLAADPPWLTGPLLTPSTQIVPFGHANVEPYQFYIANIGAYDHQGHFHSFEKLYQCTSALLAKVGLTEKINLWCRISASYNRIKDRQASGYNDIPIGLDYQLYQNDNSTYVRISIEETLSTGKYQKLNERNLHADSFGNGAFVTTFSIGASHLFHFNDRYFKPRVDLALDLISSVNVKGLNTYGGDKTTKGKVAHRKGFHFSLGAEYTLTKSLALACELLGQYSSNGKFKGKTVASSFAPLYWQMSITPSIEINFNATSGIIVSYWGSIAGRNSSKFESAVIAYNYYY